ncbi:Uncharacterized conserved protein YkaA, UPF0111/DUF47 family [Halorientalis persicus]|jgi:uncharacterized protein Yka (UPF0111/DUF47 family)|uniref:Uncharacterized conserved protein YkaA, UPF0111/DUF47 family n=1 Tax=Halorientalis persicus TaxID=1367881 RepID=A0A1H8H6V1_9EURY|nr:DUF47 family protein [Halorientalis persicus]SEN51845.1 Uncharacterized conserved protein YkaA, UPF0111/DUF47 family [Halorientalis persicus]
MQETPTSAFRTEFVEVTDRYFDALADCVESVRPGVEYYGRDEAAFCRELARARRLESDCDDLLATIRTTVGQSMGPNFTRVYFQPGGVLELFACADETANHAETFLGELAAMEPTLSAAATADFARMGDLVVEAVGVLSAAVDDLSAAPAHRAVDAVHDARDTIADLESRCDTVGRKLVSEAFATDDTAAALVVRELALWLDRAMDAVEDAAEQAVYLDSTAVATSETAGPD